MSWAETLLETKNIKKASTALSIVEVIMILFLDNIFLKNMNIDTYHQFLCSIDVFLSHVLTANFFLAVIGFLFLFIGYVILFPLIMPLLVFKILEIIAYLIAILVTIIQWLFTFIMSKIKKKPMPEFTDDTKNVFCLLRLIKIDDNNKIHKGKNWTIFESIYLDMSNENEAYDFFIKGMAFCAALLIIFIDYFNSLTLNLIAIIPLIICTVFAFSIYIFSKRMNDMRKIHKEVLTNDFIIGENTLLNTTTIT